MIREMEREHLKEAIALVNDVFSEFVAADYSEEGRHTFYEYTKHKYEALAADIESGRKAMWCCFEQGRIVGVIATRDVSHISLLFVAKPFQRRGIATQLFRTVAEAIRRQGGFSEITVHSSPYAVEIYKKLGFTPTGAEQESDGIRYTPLKYRLEG